MIKTDIVKLNKSKLDNSIDYKIFSVLSYAVVSLFAVLCVLPFLILAVSSLTSEHYIINYGYTLFPKEITLSAYETIFQNPTKIVRAYGVSIFLTVAGTSISLLVSSLAAYVMYRKDVKYRNKLAFFLYFTTLFNGGLASYYIILSKYLHLKNTILVLLLVPMFNVLYILIIRNFISGSIPDSLIESAKIDGTNDFQIYYLIVLPLSKAVLASMGLFIALGYWNDWWTAMMFVEKPQLYPLQYVLYSILSSAQMALSMVSSVASVDMPKESLKLAMTVVSIGPIILLYPSLQKYFVKGVTLGSVKG